MHKNTITKNIKKNHGGVGSQAIQSFLLVPYINRSKIFLITGVFLCAVLLD